MNTIVIEADESFNYSDTSVYITISKNICYLQNLGFIVALEIKNMNQATLHAAINFLGFYGKVYRKNIESIQFILSGDSTSKEEVQKFKKQLSEALLSKNNLQLKIQIDSPAIPLVNYIPELYDSHVLAPFAMDELFHPENWSKEMDFSLIDNVNKNGMMLSGGNGLLTWNGKQKPWWYAYNFVAKLSGNLISKGNDHLISSDGNKMVIITYNLCEEKPSYLSTLNSIEKLHKASEKKGYSREHYFKIFNLSGNYRITHYEINKSTCLFSKWFDMGCPDYLSDEDENSLHFACHPVTNYSVFQADGTIEVSTFEESFGVNCIIIEKV